MGLLHERDTVAQIVDYEELEQQHQQRQPRRIVNHDHKWAKLLPVAEANGYIAERLNEFCNQKQISVTALTALGARIHTLRNGAYELAYAGTNGHGAITAIKYRPIGGTSHQSHAESPSTWLRPIIVGDTTSLDWLIAEGETDAARLYDLIGDRCTIMALPAGARTFKREWADLIPRGARVGLCHDADQDGDKGAERAALLIGGRVVRVRPPDDQDWGSWQGDRDEFIAILQAAQVETDVREWQPRSATTFLELPEPDNIELLGPLVLRGGRTIIGGDSGHGKTTLAFAITAAILDGNEFLGHTGAGEGPALIVDLEQGIRSIKRGIREAGLHKTDTHILNLPDGLALDQNPDELGHLERVIDQLQPVVLILDPYYKAHRGDSNEERGVTDLMRNLDRLRTDYGFALILPAHVRKEQQTGGMRKLSLADIAGSGAISRGAEIVLAIERLSHGEARLRYLKDREGELPVGDHLDLTYTQDSGFLVKERPTSLSIEEQILAVEDSGWLTAKEWARELELNDGEIGRVLRRLAAADKILYETGPQGRRHNAKCYSTSGVLRVPAHHSTPGTAEGDASWCAASPAFSIGEADTAQQHTPNPAALPGRHTSTDDIPF